jgi:hypothetical protein
MARHRRPIKRRRPVKTARMAQVSSIAANILEGQSRPQNEVPLIASHGETIEKTRIQSAVSIIDSLVKGAREKPQSSLKALRESPQPSCEKPRTETARLPRITDFAPLAPGFGGIEAPSPRVTPLCLEATIDEMRSPSLHSPQLIAWTPLQATESTTSTANSVIVWIGRCSPVFNFLIAAMVGLMLLPIPDEVSTPVDDFQPTLASLHEGSSVATSARPARLAVESQTGFTNEPLPLGLSLENASGDETITVAGLANGFELSLGSSVEQASWLILSREVDKTFVGPPKDFVGVIDATVKLHSADGDLLDSNVLRLEWRERLERKANKIVELSDLPIPSARSDPSRPNRLPWTRRSIPNR